MPTRTPPGSPPSPAGSAGTAHPWLPGLLRLWHEQLPDVEIRIFEGLDEEMEQWLESGTVDAAVLIDPDPMPRGALHLVTDAYEAVVRSDHPLAGQESIELADLLDDPLLATTSSCEAPVKHLHVLTGLPYRPTQRIREFTTLLAMVEAGLGVAIIPSLAASMLPDTLTLIPLLPRLERRLVLTGPGPTPASRAPRVHLERSRGVPGGSRARIQRVGRRAPRGKVRYDRSPRYWVCPELGLRRNGGWPSAAGPGWRPSTASPVRKAPMKRAVWKATSAGSVATMWSLCRNCHELSTQGGRAL
ncbi:LysR family transcriptional regulator substrate-binding protein [Nonomuraea sp. NPDC003707]